MSSFHGQLRRNVDARLDATAITLLGEGAQQSAELTYCQLFNQVSTFAAYLRSEGWSGGRVIVVLPSGSDFIVAFVACLMAGVIGVPAPPLRAHDKRTWERLDAIARDCEPVAVIASPDMCEARLRPELRHLSVTSLRWISSVFKEADIDPFVIPPAPHGTAFIQYTSGSTSSPKGVAVSHANLEANLFAIGKKLRVSSESVVVSWLPMHHDWGLVGVVLAALYHGNRLVLMSPLHFAQKPVRWLQAISDYRGTHTGAPNFAYELCARRVTDADLATLDLSSLEVAGCGAEPIRPRTVEDFCSKFARAGFRSTSFYPCYGLAEATLFVTGSDEPREPTMLSVEQRVLENGETTIVERLNGKRVVSCGSPAEGHEVRIVDPERLTVCAEDRVGEVWVSGPSVTKGYWSKHDQPGSNSIALTADGQGGFLRTSDLGFLRHGELYIVGRLKDVIISNGRNLHPQDIEETVARFSTTATFGRTAAFSYGDFGAERFAVVVEVHSPGEAGLADLPHQLFSEIVRAHEAAPGRVVIVKPGAIPLTTSGKIRRRHASEMLLNGEFDIQSEFATK